MQRPRRGHSPGTGAQRAEAEKLLQGDQLAQVREAKSLSPDVGLSQPAKSGLGLMILQEAGLWTSIGTSLLLLCSPQANQKGATSTGSTT